MMHSKTNFYLLFAFTIFFIASVSSCAKKQTEIISTSEPKPWKVEDGFSPAPYGGSFDSLKEQKIKELIGEGYTKVRKVKLDESLLMTWRVKAALEIEERSLKDGKKSYTLVTQGYWVIDAAFLDDFAPEEAIDGKWLKLNEDLTYEYGKFEKTMGKGKYHFEPSNQILLLLDGKENVRPLEYQMEWSEAYTVMGGTPTFDDEDIRIKLINRQSKPAKYNKN
ncbi:MAG TPA: hypothetical protein PKD85_06160 [Saprospiraceae bacterium]|nr:hypothetical protein [Saprospiraceae bacterium]